jgi:UDP-N-acetylmuramyl pentapeptide phosphotransferase/UDP-N-acetylglucosamine-1-phosphate transferase
MSLELEALLALLIGAGVGAVALPPMARLARATGIVDVPGGYKQHDRPTPYLGGVAVLLAVLTATLIMAGVSSPIPAIALAAIAICALGTLDDRRPIPAGVRLAVQTAVAVIVWDAGAGWSLSVPDGINLVLTVGWVLLAANAFNLIDNLDGTASSAAALSALGIVVIGFGAGLASWPALVAAAVLGACVAFLPYNLARPARIFLGDGGSTLLGFLVAVAAMGALSASSVPTALVAAVLLVAAPLLDTAATMTSRRRRGSPILAGGRDHITHEIYARAGSARLTAATIAIVQGACSALAFAVVRLHEPVLSVLAVVFLLTLFVAITRVTRPTASRAPHVHLDERDRRASMPTDSKDGVRGSHDASGRQTIRREVMHSG